MQSIREVQPASRRVAASSSVATPRAQGVAASGAPGLTSDGASPWKAPPSARTTGSMPSPYASALTIGDKRHAAPRAQVRCIAPNGVEIDVDPRAHAMRGGSVGVYWLGSGVMAAASLKSIPAHGVRERIEPDMSNDCRAADPAPAPRSLDDALALMRDLRARCDWDRVQTHASLRPYLIEEAHEVDDAIAEGDDAVLRDELGDLLLQVLFHSVVAEERGAFGAQDVAGALVAKMHARHPHLYGDGVKRSWEAMKAAEGRCVARSRTGIPAGLPSLHRAHRLQDRAAGVGLRLAGCPRSAGQGARGDRGGGRPARPTTAACATPTRSRRSWGTCCSPW